MVTPIPYKKAERDKSSVWTAIKKNRRAAFTHYVLLNKTLQISLLLLLAALVPLLVFSFVFTRGIGSLPLNPVYQGTCSQRSSLHIPCGVNLTQSICISRGCCYNDRYGCFHFYPSKHRYEKSSENPPPGIYNLVPSYDISPLGNSMMKNVAFSVLTKNNYRLQVNLWIADSSSSEKFPGDTEHREADFYYDIAEPTLELRVYRDNSKEKLLLTTFPGPWIVSNNYIELAFYLGTEILLGLDELHLKPGFRKTIINNEYQSPMPIIWAYDAENAKYHGLLIKSTYPLEVEITESYMVLVRGIFDNMNFSYELLVGDGIENVLDNLQSVLRESYGIKPAYSQSNLKYGFHICDQDSERSQYDQGVEMQKFLDEGTLSTVPFDSHCIKENGMYMNSQSTPLDYLDELRKANKSTIATLVLALKVEQPGNSSELSDYQENLMRDASGSDVYLGVHNQNKVVYWDWANSQTDKLKPMLDKLIATIRDNYDGLILQSNWLQDNTKIRKTPAAGFPFLPEDLEDKMRHLLPWFVRKTDAPQENLIRNYNFFGTEAIRIMAEYLGNEIGHLFLMAESSLYPHANTVYKNFDAPTWSLLRSNLRQMLANSLSGIYSAGSSICGHPNGDDGDEEADDPNQWAAKEELCVRWYQFASMSPIFKVDVSNSPLNFGNLDRKLIARATRRRYGLSTYFETMSLADPMLPLNRPLFFYYSDYLLDISTNTNSAIQDQFMVGDSLMVVPVLLPRIRELTVFFPDHFYEFESGLPMPFNSTATIAIVRDDLPMFIKAGAIVPLHQSHEALSLAMARRQNLSLVIALRWDKNTAEGHGLIKTTTGTEIQLSCLVETSAENTMFIFNTNVTTIGTDFCGNEPSVSSLVTEIKVYGLPIIGNIFLTETDHLVLCDLSIDLCEYTEFRYKIPSNINSIDCQPL